MAQIGQVTLDQLTILSVDADPAASSTPAKLGSIALLDDNTNPRMWIKSGAADNAWSLVPRQANATQYATGGIPFSDASGNLIVATSKIYWDNTNNRLSLGANAPATPQSTIHIDRGNATGGHVRFTAGTTTGQAAGDGTEFGIDDTGAAEIRQYENSNINFYTNNLIRGVFDNNGKFILGYTQGIDITGAAAIPQFQIIGSAAVQMAGIQYSNDTIGPVFNIIKSRGAAAPSQVIVQDGDEFGRFQFRASDGTNFQAGASIRALVDGTPGSLSMPGRLILMTTPTGATVPVERIRIDSTGQTILSQHIRIGAGTGDTTNGNLQFNGSEFLIRQASTWMNLGIAPITTQSTSTQTTTSGTFQVLTETQQTPAAGTYLAIFMGQGDMNANGTLNLALYVAGVQQAGTLRSIRVANSLGTSQSGSPMSFITTITLNGSQQVDVRFNRVTAGTSSILARTFMLIPMSR